MNTIIRLSYRGAALVALFSVASLAQADAQSQPNVKEPKTTLNVTINEADAAYRALQGSTATAIPNWVVARAKGVIFLSRWTISAGVGGTGGAGIGMKKNSDGTFSAPAFYTVGGASLGVQVGVSKTQTVAFLLSDKALKTLTDNKFVWSGNVKAVAGPHSTAGSTLDDSIDIVLYQKSTGLDVGAMVAGTEVEVDNEDNRKFYDAVSLTPSEIFAGKVSIPDSAKALIDSLNKQASAK